MATSMRTLALQRETRRSALLHPRLLREGMLAKAGKAASSRARNKIGCSRRGTEKLPGARSPPQLPLLSLQEMFTTECEYPQWRAR